jgi:hypothetical protein
MGSRLRAGSRLGGRGDLEPLMLVDRELPGVAIG